MTDHSLFSPAFNPQYPTVTAYVDGACSGNPGAMGCGIVLISGDHRKEFSFPLGDGTNQRAEILAVIKAMECLTRPCNVTVYSDSEYVVRTGKGEFKRRANADLWTLFDAAIARHNVTFEWVKGHADNADNQRADSLALMGAQQSRMRVHVGGAR